MTSAATATATATAATATAIARVTTATADTDIATGSDYIGVSTRLVSMTVSMTCTTVYLMKMSIDCKRLGVIKRRGL